ncbi:MOSC domain-containing protein [Paenibacillus sp. BIHB 4019]|nr:MOSC domain-containing protein [Paenibacillus sp. BIHB 4019]
MVAGSIKSINIGMPQQVPYLKKEVLTGIHKHPVQDAVKLTAVCFEGDGQADLVHHGGEDKAVCVYPFEHYAYWETQGLPMNFGAFGENLTTQGIVEEDIHIGDTFQLGTAIVQVSQPRQPCFKLSVKYGLPELPLQVQQTGYTGYYFRVLKEGVVSPSDSFMCISKHPAALSISYANQIMHVEKTNQEGMERLLAAPELSSSWRATFTKRLAGMETDTTERLSGQAANKQAD